MSSEDAKHWFPLESNPEVINKFVSEMGYDTSEYSFSDLYSTDDWALAMVPSPLKAIVMLFPCTENQEAHRIAQAVDIDANGQVVSENVFHISQYCQKSQSHQPINIVYFFFFLKSNFLLFR